MSEILKEKITQNADDPFLYEEGMIPGAYSIVVFEEPSFNFMLAPVNNLEILPNIHERDGAASRQWRQVAAEPTDFNFTGSYLKGGE